MATEVGSAFVSILPSMKGIGSAISHELDPAAEKAGASAGAKAGGGFASKMKGAITPLNVGLAGLAAVHVLGGFISDARESAKVAALTAQVIKTTGGAANITAGQVGDLATAISNKTGVDDEAIQSGENLLLTFTNVKNEVGKGNDIFNQATSIMTDMSVALGTDAKGSAIQLGKALNDPVKGVTALSKVGVSFTEQQKAQIKTLVESGNTLGAQKIILTELGREFGGAAEAAATPSAKLKVTIGNLSETIGGLLIPVVDTVAGALNSFTLFVLANQNAIGIAAAVIGAVMVPLLVKMGVEATISGVKTVLSWVTSSGAAVASAAAQLAAGAAVVGSWVLMGVQSLLQAARMAAAWLIALGPVGLVIAAVVAVTVLIVKNWSTIRAATVAAWGAVVSAVRSAAGFITGLVSGVVSFIRSHWVLLLGILTGPIGLAVAAIAGHWARIKAGAAAAFSAVKNVITGALTGIKNAITGALTVYVGLFSSLPRRILGAVGNLGGLLKHVGESIIQGLIDGIGGMVGKLTDKLHFITKLIPFHKGPPAKDRTLLVPAGRMIIEGLIAGFDDRTGAVKAALGSLTRDLSAADLRAQSSGLRGTVARAPNAASSAAAASGASIVVHNNGRDLGPADIAAGLGQWQALHGAPLLMGA